MLKSIRSQSFHDFESQNNTYVPLSPKMHKHAATSFPTAAECSCMKVELQLFAATQADVSLLKCFVSVAELHCPGHLVT